MKGISRYPDRCAQGRGGSLNELCFEAAGGDPYLALWLAVCYFDVFERAGREQRQRAREMAAAA